MNWINVKKELPPNDTNCVVWVEKGRFYDEGFYEVIFNSNYFGVTNNKFINYENGGEYETDFTEQVTHWMIPTKPSDG